MYTEILYEVADRIATITLNRPDKLNAWTSTMDREVREAMYRAEADEDVRVIILTGAGRGFCSGADMSLLNGLVQQGLTDEAKQTLHGYASEVRPGVALDFQRKYTYFASLRKPVIAAINGPAVGLGFILSLYCDLLFASEEARFGTAFARRGLIAEYGIAWMLPRLIGQAAALDLMLSARVIPASEALSMRLVNAVFPARTFIPQVRAYAMDLARNVSPRSVAVIKRQAYNAMLQSLDESLEAAQKEMLLSLQSDDFREGVAHFLEKRDPVFQGR